MVAKEGKDSLLIIGGLGSGGVNTFIEEQTKYMSKNYRVEVHNTSPHTDILLLSIILSIYQVLKFPLRRRPDIVHVNSSADLAFYRNWVYILFAAYVWNRPVIARFGGSGFDEFIKTESKPKWYFIDIVLSSIDQILVLTELQKTAVTQYVSEENVQILQQATEVDKFSPQFEHQRPRVLFLSSLNKRKGVPEFIQVVERLAENSDLNCKKIRVEIAGDGEFRQEVEELAKKYEWVNYHGYVTGDKKFELYNESSIFVLPTHSEGFPNVIIEAMAGGNALVVTSASGIPEIVGEENGLVVEPGNVEEQFTALKILISDSNLVKEMAKRNREVAINNHGWSATAEQLEQIYQRLISESNDDSVEYI